MSLSPVQVRFLMSVSPQFRDVMARTAQAVAAAGPQIEALHKYYLRRRLQEQRHRVRMQYRGRRR